MTSADDVAARKRVLEQAARILANKKRIEECDISFTTFVKLAWNHVEQEPLHWNWHMDAICQHCEAVIKRQVRNLIINVPPRSSKSTIVSIMLPAWRWMSELPRSAYAIEGCPNGPAERFMTVSFGQKLATRHARQCRDLINSPWYQQLWAHRYQLRYAQNQKNDFENDKGGYRIAASFESGVTGSGAGVLIMDDPDDLDRVDSVEYRRGNHDTYDGSLVTRGINPRTDVRLCIQQRGHEDDMTAHLEQFGNWEKLVIPMQYEGPTSATVTGFTDPRTEFGESLDPERFSEEYIEEKRRVLGPRYSAQYQQRPAAAEGQLLKREWFQYWTPGSETAERYRKVDVKDASGRVIATKTAVTLPLAFEQVVHSYDLSFKRTDTSDFVAGHVWGRVGANIYLIARDTKRRNFPETLTLIRQMSDQYPCPEKLVEDKANGPAVIDTLKAEIPGLIAVNEAGGKEARVNAVSGYVQAGNVFLPNPDIYPWVLEILEQLANFPKGKHDDDVDAFTQAAKRLFGARAYSAFPEARVLPREGEPENAYHIENCKIEPWWRKWIAVSPGGAGAAVWLAETPSGAIRVYREADISGLDAVSAGEKVAELTIPDIDAYMRRQSLNVKWRISVLMEKEAFVPVEPVGCYAEMFEDGLRGWKPTTAEYDERLRIEGLLRLAKFGCEQTTITDATFDQMRDLMRFAPPDFEKVSYDRDKAIKLLQVDPQAYQRYMAAVEGKVVGEWPKIRFDASCVNTTSALGMVRRDEEVENPFMRALLLGISAPDEIAERKPPREVDPLSIRRTAPTMRRKFRGGRY